MRTIKRLKVMSDLHLEWCYFNYQPSPEDADTLLILAGDIVEIYAIAKCENIAPGWGPAREERAFNAFCSFLESIRGKFAAVVAVAGNHEWYSSAFNRKNLKVLKNFYQLHDVIFLENESYTFENKGGKPIEVFGSTFWTDFRQGSPMVMLKADVMADYELIYDDRFPGAKITPELIYHENLVARRELTNHLNALNEKYGMDRDGFISLVVTHHLPVMNCVNKKYMTQNQDYNYLYANTGMYDFFCDDGWKIDYWFHGHTHEAVDLMMWDTRILCNPRGYYRDVGGRAWAAEYQDEEFDETRGYDL